MNEFEKTIKKVKLEESFYSHNNNVDREILQDE